jgi:hypothetical protein
MISMLNVYNTVNEGTHCGVVVAVAVRECHCLGPAFMFGFVSSKLLRETISGLTYPRFEDTSRVSF